MKKLLSSTILAFILIAVQVGTVFAQDTTTSNTGTVTKVEIKTDATTGAVTEVVATYTDSTGAIQTVSLTLADAITQGLVTTDPITGLTTVSDTAVDSTVTIPDPTTQEAQHPVGSALSDFFSSLLGVDYDTIMSYHNGDEGSVVGFGVIAQALWLTKETGGDTSTFKALLDAKTSGDYSSIILADGLTPNNWGDVVKSLKKGDNLGSVKSGHADNDADAASTGNGKGNNADATSTDQDNGNGINNGNDNGNNANGHGNGGGNGHGNGGGNGHGKP